jgi:hypothetical protein
MPINEDNDNIIKFNLPLNPVFTAVISNLDKNSQKKSLASLMQIVYTNSAIHKICFKAYHSKPLLIKGG